MKLYSVGVVAFFAVSIASSQVNRDDLVYITGLLNARSQAMFGKDNDNKLFTFPPKTHAIVKDVKPLGTSGNYGLCLWPVNVEGIPKNQTKDCYWVYYRSKDPNSNLKIGSLSGTLEEKAKGLDNWLKSVKQYPVKAVPIQKPDRTKAISKTEAASLPVVTAAEALAPAAVGATAGALAPAAVGKAAQDLALAAGGPAAGDLAQTLKPVAVVQEIDGQTIGAALASGVAKKELDCLESDSPDLTHSQKQCVEGSVSVSAFKGEETKGNITYALYTCKSAKTKNGKSTIKYYPGVNNKSFKDVLTKIGPGNNNVNQGLLEIGHNYDQMLKEFDARKSNEQTLPFSDSTSDQSLQKMKLMAKEINQVNGLCEKIDGLKQKISKERNAKEPINLAQLKAISQDNYGFYSDDYLACKDSAGSETAPSLKSVPVMFRYKDASEETFFPRSLVKKDDNSYSLERVLGGKLGERTITKAANGSLALNGANEPSRDISAMYKVSRSNLFLNSASSGKLPGICGSFMDKPAGTSGPGGMINK